MILQTCLFEKLGRFQNMILQRCLMILQFSVSRFGSFFKNEAVNFEKKKYFCPSASHNYP